ICLLHSSLPPHPLHSFPTRRSSDLKVSYAILEEKALIPEIAPYVTIKFPTADENRGLGTGEYDETIGVDLSKRLIHGLFGYLSRSEEHTSELQSRGHLVCRLLLEKK